MKKQFKIGDLVGAGWLHRQTCDYDLNGIVVEVEKIDHDCWRYKVRHVEGFEVWKSREELLLRASANGK
jgi:hypothetical protein